MAEVLSEAKAPASGLARDPSAVASGLQVDFDSFWRVEDFEAPARERLSPAVREFLYEVPGTGRTYRGNRAAFESWQFEPHVLVDVSRRDLATTVLGQRIDLPVMIAPTALHRLYHPDGELATVRAAASAGTLAVLSTSSSYPLEDIVAAAGPTSWFQLYWLADREITRYLVQRAFDADCSAICLTVDAAVPAWREHELRTPFVFPDGVRQANLPPGSGPHSHASELTWKSLEWLRSLSPLPLVLKGVLRSDDARLAVEHGVDALIVSNHGGRQLDGTVASLDALPRVRDAVQDRLEIYLDGGVRGGSDVATAIALGARAVLIGRPALWGLTVGGEAGVSRVLAILRGQLEAAMGLLGAPTLRDLTPDLLRRC
jgi:4-hydroxymandelate oxidase